MDDGCTALLHEPIRDQVLLVVGCWLLVVGCFVVSVRPPLSSVACPLLIDDAVLALQKAEVVCVCVCVEGEENDVTRGGTLTFLFCVSVVSLQIFSNQH